MARDSEDTMIDRIPDSELEIMNIIWEHEAPVSRQTIEEAVAAQRPLAQTTILTLLTRLAKKELVSVTKNGRSSEYTPLIGKEEYLASQSRRFIERECGHKMSIFASALAGGLSKDEIEELRALLASEE